MESTPNLMPRISDLQIKNFISPGGKLRGFWLMLDGSGAHEIN